ncbi:MAG: hypothetical protein PHF72_07715 [Gammaproteobacteria bacterium]|nr:hypothetical protein [Gammaproteobacteria bacterium]
MDAPRIGTAIPKRRYQLGEYGLVVLGEVASLDGRDYTWIMALTRDGEARPDLFVTSEANPPGEREQGSHRLRVIAASGEKVLGSSDGLSDIDNFATVAIGITKQLFKLEDEQEMQLL